MMILFHFALLALVGVAAVERFGTLGGLGLLAAVWLLMPWKPGGAR